MTSAPATGLFSMYAALRPDIAVYAFEPKATSFGVLVEHLALNGMGERVFPLCIALSDRTEATRLTLSAMSPGSGGNSVGGAPDQFGLSHSVFSQGALAYRLDDLIATFRLPGADAAEDRCGRDRGGDPAGRAADASRGQQRDDRGGGPERR